MLTIYHVPGTRGVRAIWLCEELALPYTVEAVDFSPEFRASESWRAMNPVGKVPVLRDSKGTSKDDFFMFESGAMVQYILDRYGNGQLQPTVGTSRMAPTCSGAGLQKRPSLGHWARSSITAENSRAPNASTLSLKKCKTEPCSPLRLWGPQ